MMKKGETQEEFFERHYQRMHRHFSNNICILETVTRHRLTQILLVDVSTFITMWHDRDWFIHCFVLWSLKNSKHDVVAQSILNGNHTALHCSTPRQRSAALLTMQIKYSQNIPRKVESL